MAELSIERKGGLAGAGMAGSAMVSRGTVDLDSLSAEDRKAVDGLFDSAADRPVGRITDGFEYHLTRTTTSGTRTIVVPERAVPAAVRKAVRDELLPR